MPIIATAGWSIPKNIADRFATGGSSLTRYASVLNGVEINSTFYRRHKRSTFARWADAVPDSFQFAVKMPKDITHAHAMKCVAGAFSTFIEDIEPLGKKRGPLLCQMPPSLAFDAGIESAFQAMRDCDDGPIVVEARHESWTSADALKLLNTYALDRVFADPSPVWKADEFETPPKYLRLHGRPKIYYSSYTADEIRSFSDMVASDGWCVFDNTAAGAAIDNALTVLEDL
ncbi:DUF72 domain-containing protein [Rhizobium sp. 2MFCol3.1]|uniref:DUF72 domain-containing protein n=1 Tax=Rhizobium sp. 2MFCol3.1 TaxID=1246459 RepID=UPI00035F809F|nr:DUF72 domain-containing protein [Rhizobium sp. 2MFCol3.1]